MRSIGLYSKDIKDYNQKPEIPEISKLEKENLALSVKYKRKIKLI
jgi:hypothetical protein